MINFTQVRDLDKIYDRSKKNDEQVSKRIQKIQKNK